MTNLLGTEITNSLQEKLGMKDMRNRASKLDYTFVVSNLEHYKREGGVFFRAYEIGAGIVWAYTTGRLTYEAETAIRNMKALPFARFIGLVSNNCKTQGDIPQFLNNHFRS